MARKILYADFLTTNKYLLFLIVYIYLFIVYLKIKKRESCHVTVNIKQAFKYFIKCKL